LTLSAAATATGGGNYFGNGNGDGGNGDGGNGSRDCSRSSGGTFGTWQMNRLVPMKLAACVHFRSRGMVNTYTADFFARRSTHHRPKSPSNQTPACLAPTKHITDCAHKVWRRRLGPKTPRARAELKSAALALTKAANTLTLTPQA